MHNGIIHIGLDNRRLTLKRILKPITVREGSAAVKIYGTPVVSKGKKYSAFTVRYYFDGQTQQKKFGDLAKAQKHAAEAAQRINNGSVQVMLMSEQDRMEWSEAKKKLNGVPAMRAVDFYLSRHPDSITAKTTREVYDELLESKRQDGISESWLRDLRKRLLRFVERFPCPVTELSGPEMDAWLRTLGLSGKSRNNYRICISTFVSFAKDRRYLPKDFDELESIKIVKEKTGAITVFTPEEIQALLNAARPADLPFLALGAFAGVRTAEMSRLTWGDIGSEFLTVASEKAKTRNRRVVPVLPCLKSFLDSIRQPEGSVWPYATITMHSDALARLVKASEVKWKKNALRHSFISYRLAITQNTAQVALECGTSERKIFTNYRELVSVEAAKAYFGIFYKPVTNSGIKEPSSEVADG